MATAVSEVNEAYDLFSNLFYKHYNKDYMKFFVRSFYNETRYKSYKNIFEKTKQKLKKLYF